MGTYFFMYDIYIPIDAPITARAKPTDTAEIMIFFFIELPLF